MVLKNAYSPGRISYYGLKMHIELSVAGRGEREGGMEGWQLTT